MNEVASTQPQEESRPVATVASISLLPRTLEEAMKFAKVLAASDIIPKDYVGKEANVLVAVQWGMELGLQPLQAMQNIAVINGRPSLWGDAVIALVQASPVCLWVKEEIGDTSATCTTHRRGDPEPESRTFTVDDAKKAGLWAKQGPWTNYPKRMLQMRARSWCLRDKYPDVLRGVAIAEEVQDQPIDVTPRATVEMPVVNSRKDAPAPTQDVAEAPARKVEGAVETVAEQAAPATGTQPLSEGQLRIIRAKLKFAALNDRDLVAKFGAIEEIKFAQFDAIQEWISTKTAA